MQYRADKTKKSQEEALSKIAKLAAVFAVAALSAAAAPAAGAWTPTKPIEFIATAGPGGGTDNFARAVQSIIVKYKLVDQPIVVDEKGVILPARSFTWARGRPSGGGSVPLQGLVLVWTTSDR